MQKAQRETIIRLVRQLAMMLVDYLIVILAYLIAYSARVETLDQQQLDKYLEALQNNVFYWGIVYIVIFYFSGIYKSIWRYTGVEEALKIGLASVLSTVICFLSSLMLVPRMPYSIAIITASLVALIECALRIGYMVIARHISNKAASKDEARVNLLIVGAGDAGSTIIREIMNQPKTRYNIVGIVDDDKMKHGSRLHNVDILGDTSDIRDIVAGKEIDEIIIAIPSASFEQLSEVLACCPRKGVRLRIMSSVYDGRSNQSAIKHTHEINLEQLLGRDEVLNSEAGQYIEGKTVMVTGGGGSIGSELCNQIMSFNPKQLVIFDIFENNAYDTVNNLKIKYNKPDKMCVVIGSVTDEKVLRRTFERFRPDVVFHAAAYKHVPLMEDYPDQAVRNNVFGTYNTVRLSHEFGVHRFVMVSTDKAVNPTNVMGATKRVAELVVQAYDTISDTEFVAVRFGNVLGSAGSVVPLFKQQIEAGGPITITHPDITRFFMTIPEAAGLVLQAGAIAEGGEVFILDMGKPVRVMDIAYNMIYLSGLVPNQDIEIKIVGLRPGEKLYEELMLKEEGITASKSKKIFVAQPSNVTIEDAERYISQLRECVDNDGDVRDALVAIVPTYKPTNVPEQFAKDNAADGESNGAAETGGDDCYSASTGK